MNFQKFLQHSGLDHKQYQEDGVNWCISREEPLMRNQGQDQDQDQDQDQGQDQDQVSSRYCNGGIIADEMGLGKTIMMIGTIVANFKMPTLIVLPVVLIEQWKEQFQRTAGHTPLIYHGQTIKLLTSDELQRTPIILTSYGTVLSDARKHKKLQQVKWSRIICDEAHHLKNRRTKISRVICALKTNIMWLISGTPIQNHINDLYSLFDILKIPNKVYTDTEQLKKIISTIVLKRTKKEVGIQLPSLHVNRVRSNWTSILEQEMAEDIHEKMAFSKVGNKRNRAQNQQQNEQVNPISKGAILSLMLYARMMCVYPSLAQSHISKMKAYGYVSAENPEEALQYSSKMDSVIQSIIARKDNKNRKIVFTNFRGEIDYLKKSLMLAGLTTESIDGRVTGKRMRQEILQKDLDVLILQIKTGNEGLNLQQYNEVYFVTPEWNPKLEEQAIARCHRIGQTKQVHVFRFIMDSFDEKQKTNNIEMYTETVQENKNKMGNEVLSCNE